MVDQGLFKIPSEQTLKNRRAFYTLWRRCDDGTKAWLKRMRSCIRRCEFPSIIAEFLLFDRCICGFDASELKSIQSVDNFWTFEQLLDFYVDESSGIGSIESDLAVTDIFNQSQNAAQNKSVESESVENEGESLQTAAHYKPAGESDPFAEIEVKATNEEHTVEDGSSTANDQWTMFDDEMDHDTSASSVDDHQNQFDYKIKRKRTNSSRNQSKKPHGKRVGGGSGDDGRTFECFQCHKSLTTFYGLKTHLFVHSDEKPLICDECGKLFRFKSGLRAHKFSVHQQNRPHVCPQCDKAFSQATSLRRHALTHLKADERPHACGECDKSFATMDQLKVHRLTHTTERPFACDQCQKAFKDVGRLKRHKQFVHEQISVYSCPVCYRHFSTVQNLKVHMKIHSDERPSYVCGQCDKSFQSVHTLKAHNLVVHEGIRAHSCSQCNKRFSTVQNLRNHMNVHSGERPFACDQCDKAFGSSQPLKAHKLVVHEGIRAHSCPQCNKRFSTAQNLRSHMNVHKKARLECSNSQ